MFVSDFSSLIALVSQILDEVESGFFDQATVETDIKRVFSALCGDFPGAVSVRLSVNHLRKLAALDYEESALESEGVGVNQNSPLIRGIHDSNEKASSNATPELSFLHPEGDGVRILTLGALIQFSLHLPYLILSYRRRGR